eukprot:CAMPEP_0115652424 /NCGR_PEP_ID=MMETSP0272-20121206/42058_1 /TAXON_ID=71861 /ORGANISM="Scrippsiella trochoidea, Strain CCMP3099" /LENGTH=197 /DNA_ID=CAMNT_0003090221 /DNA_START=1 /DNA_END=591 /DNA_ORIENTATION=+
MAEGMDRDQKLTIFLDSLGQDADLDFARGMLEAHDWDLEAALLTVTGAGGGGGGAGAAGRLDDPAAPLVPDVDEEGYRAPMRTGYTDQLIGPDPDDFYAQAFAGTAAYMPEGAMDVDQGGEGGAPGGDGRRRSSEMRRAMEASAAEYSRLAEQDEQGQIAQAIEASYAAHMSADMQRFSADGMQAEREEQEAIARAI